MTTSYFLPAVHPRCQADELASELLASCLAGRPHSSVTLGRLIEEANSSDPAKASRGTGALFGVVVERLSDLFEPAFADAYVSLFAEVCERTIPELGGTGLIDRYRRIRQTRTAPDREPRRVFVLSRVTLGADIAVTSVLLDAVKRRYPAADIWFVGPRKNYELFESDHRIRHMSVDYGRGWNLRERLMVWTSLRTRLDEQDALIVDPDSRLTQLGLLPVCPEERYLFFESRTFGSDSGETLTRLAARWCAETFGVAEAAAFIAPLPPEGPPYAEGRLTVSLGVGGNAGKMLGEQFEAGLLEQFGKRGEAILIDSGAGGEEAERVKWAAAAVKPPGSVVVWRGGFAAFAARIARSRMFAGYDSAAQHAAAACGVPLIVVFSGFAGEKTFLRWQPHGRGPKAIVRAEDGNSARALTETSAAYERLRCVTVSHE